MINETTPAREEIEKYCRICKRCCGHWTDEHYLIYPEDKEKPK